MYGSIESIIAILISTNSRNVERWKKEDIDLVRDSRLQFSFPITQSFNRSANQCILVNFDRIDDNITSKLRYATSSIIYVW